MPDGIIIKGISGFYYVKCDDKIIECKARGIFRNINKSPMVGDKVEVEYCNEKTDEGIITKIHDRKNELVRPTVANTDQVIIVVAVISPEPNLLLIDKLLIACEQNNLDVCLCLNKIDLITNDDYKIIVNSYEMAGYKVIKTSCRTNEGINDLKDVLRDKISVFAGASGVGKSSLLNCINSNFKLKTGDISKKIKRGKHVTRHVELLELDNKTYVADTPGFTAIDLSNVKVEQLKTLYKEFKNYENMCAFSDCSHISEPDCAIIEAVNNKKISINRHNNYKSIYNRLNSVKEW